MIIQSIYDLNIFIDDINITAAEGCTLVSAEIAESIANPVPTCKLNVTLPLGLVDYRSLVDGTQLVFDIKAPSINFAEKLTFRLYTIEHLEVTQQFCSLELTGLLDFYAGYSHANEHNLYGTSADVFRGIANTYKLNAEIDDTNDTQLWVSGENNLFQFLMNISQYGWVDDTSAMFWCIDRHKTLLYKNLTSLFRKRSNKPWTFIQASTPCLSEKQYEYATACVSIQAGHENLTNEGYGGSDRYFDLPSYSWKDPVARKVVAESNLININKELSQGLAQSFYSFDIGNFHPKYWIAKKQNARILSTYSTYVTIQCSFLMNYRIGQIVNFYYADSRDFNNTVNLASGTFMIDAIKYNITRSEISPTLELVMQGLNGQAITRETY